MTIAIFEAFKCGIGSPNRTSCRKALMTLIKQFMSDFVVVRIGLHAERH